MHNSRTHTSVKEEQSGMLLSDVEQVSVELSVQNHWRVVVDGGDVISCWSFPTRPLSSPWTQLCTAGTSDCTEVRAARCTPPKDTCRRRRRGKGELMGDTRPLTSRSSHTSCG